MSDLESDLVVVGGGMAGLVAAARAAELGLVVTVLEKGAGEHPASNARWSGGVLHVAYTDILSPPQHLRAIIERATEGTADKAQADAFSANAGRFIAWLSEKGVIFVGTKVDWQQFILAPMRAMRAGLDWEDRGPDRLLVQLAGVVRGAGGRLVHQARAQRLRLDGDRVAGVEADTPGGAQSFAARAVLLADGGFQANRDLLARHITPHPQRIKQRGAGNGTGDALRMAEAAGAELTGLDRFYGHILARDALTNDGVWPYPELDALATSGILVDAQGRRFADEGVGGIALTNLIARSSDPLGATIIFDAEIWEGPGRSARIPANPTLEAAGGTVLRAASIAEVASLAGLPAESLAETVGAHNRALAAGTLSSLVPPRSSARYKPMAIASPPYHAIPVCAGITYTMGGIRIAGDGRVLRPDGTAIAGLWAAGSCTGGLEGGGNVAYLGGLAKAAVQGLLAAESIAGRSA